MFRVMVSFTAFAFMSNGGQNTVRETEIVLRRSNSNGILSAFFSFYILFLIALTLLQQSVSIIALKWKSQHHLNCFVCRIINGLMCNFPFCENENNFIFNVTASAVDTQPLTTFTLEECNASNNTWHRYESFSKICGFHLRIKMFSVSWRSFHLYHFPPSFCFFLCVLMKLVPLLMRSHSCYRRLWFFSKNFFARFYVMMFLS